MAKFIVACVVGVSAFVIYWSALGILIWETMQHTGGGRHEPAEFIVLAITTLGGGLGTFVGGMTGLAATKVGGGSRSSVATVFKQMSPTNWLQTVISALYILTLLVVVVVWMLCIGVANASTPVLLENLASSFVGTLGGLIAVFLAS